jgi:hypothetical protein
MYENGKMRPVETVVKNGGGGKENKGEWWRQWI